MSRDAQPQAAVALFGKKAPAAPKKAAVKPMFGKPKAKPAAKKPAAKKPAAKKPAAKKTAAKAKPLFSFGTAKKAAPKKATASKSKYTITKTAGTVKKSKPTTFKTVNIGAKKPAAKPMGVKPMGGAKAPSAPREPKPAVYDRETVGTAGVASIFAGTFLLTLAALPAATEAALEVIGIGYSGYFLYNWVANPESRGELDKTLTKIDDETGINLKKVASAITNLAGDVSKKLAEQAEKSAEQAAKARWRRPRWSRRQRQTWWTRLSPRSRSQSPPSPRRRSPPSRRRSRRLSRRLRTSDAYRRRLDRLAVFSFRRDECVDTTARARGGCEGMRK